MDLVNDLENELALTFLVEKNHSERLDSQEVLALMNKVREVLQPISIEENPNEPAFAAGQISNSIAH